MKKLWKPALLLAAIVVMAIGMLGSGAWFTDSKISGTSTLASGKLEIDGAGISNFNLGTISPMAPGDKTDFVTVTIKNSGTTNLIWMGDLVVSGNETLKKAIYIEDATMEFVAKDGGTWAEPIDHFITNGVGSGLYPGWYNTLASLSTFGVNSLDVYDGNNGMGTAPYEFVGALKPGYAYKLTLRFGFAEGADNSYANKTLYLNFKVDATQPTAAAIAAKFPFLPAGSVYWEAWALGQIGNQN